MYPKSWRYYRNSLIFWTLLIILLMVAGYALRHPVYWIVALFIWFLLNSARQAFIFAHPYRRFGWMKKTPLEFREVTFKTHDGLTLFGRFIPARNQATIILVHGLGSANNDMLVYAELLVDAGYGVFMIDLRAHGSSDGDTSTYGWREADDVVGAVNYLQTRLDVHGDKIGVLGFSLGAQAALRAALKTDKIKALVLEGLGPMTFNDHGGKPNSLIRWAHYPANWLYYHLYEFMIGGKDSGVLEVIGTLAPRPILLIASGANDIYFSRLFFKAAQEPKELWELPNGTHGGAILQDPKEYTKRVLDFFNKGLGVN